MNHSISELLHPLSRFYAETARTLPACREIAGDEMPEPYRQLLVHRNDMTPTLVRYHESTLHLEILTLVNRADAYARQVLLRADRDQSIVEFGAIEIHLERFPDAAQALIRGNRQPLGAIMADHAVTHHSVPVAFFAIEPDPDICAAMALAEPQTLYGRRNTLYTDDEHPLAEVCEILPPADDARLGAGGQP